MAAVNETTTLTAEFKFKEIPDEGETATESTSSTFVFGDEDHTLGNALRHCLQQRTADVEFCGYSVPHPTEPYMHLRLQTRGGRAAKAVLGDGLRDLAAMCTAVKSNVEGELAQHRR